MKYTKQNIANWLRMIKQASAMQAASLGLLGGTPRYDMPNFPYQEDADFTLRMIEDGYITAYEIRKGSQGEPKQFYGVRITTKGDELMVKFPFKKTLRQKFHSITPGTWKVLAYVITTAIAAVVATVQVMNYLNSRTKAAPTVIFVPVAVPEPKPATQETQSPAEASKPTPAAPTSPAPAGKP